MVSFCWAHTKASAGQSSFIQTSHGLDKRGLKDTLRCQDFTQSA